MFFVLFLYLFLGYLFGPKGTLKGVTASVCVGGGALARNLFICVASKLLKHIYSFLVPIFENIRPANELLINIELDV